MTKTVNWLGQQVKVDGHLYMVIYFYLPDEQVHPVNNIIFDLSKRPMRRLSTLSESDAKIRERVLESKDVDYLTKDQIRLVEKLLNKNQKKFESYLKYHNQNLGDILDWRVVAGQELAYVFNGSAISKIYMFTKDSNKDYQLVIPYYLTLYQILIELEMLKHILQNTKVNANLFIQVAQNMFFAVMPNQEKSYLVDICIWDETRQKIRVYSNTVISDSGIRNEGKEDDVKLLADKLEQALKIIINKESKDD